MGEAPFAGLGVDNGRRRPVRRRGTSLDVRRGRRVVTAKPARAPVAWAAVSTAQNGPAKPGRVYVARLVGGAERQEWWDLAVATWPTYGEYQKRTSRQIPIFLLEAV